MSEEAELVSRARAGDRAALEALVSRANDLVYNLAVRMLGNVADAEDASQEILIRIVTSLATFRGESAFRTWVYQVASNHLLTAWGKKAGRKEQTFEGVEEHLAEGLRANLPALEDQVMVTEAKLVCTSNMLLALDRDYRLAFVLGEVLELSSDEGSDVLGIAPDAFRKRLSRARERMGDFMKRNCSIVRPENPCRCGKQIACAVAKGFSANAVSLATHPARRPARPTDASALAGLAELERVTAVFRSHPDYLAPDSLVSELRTLLSSKSSGP